MNQNRTATIGMYSDRVALSIRQTDRKGNSFCLYRKEIEGDFFEKGEVDTDRLAGQTQKLIALSEQMLCDEIVCLGYGVLRYASPKVQEQLERKLSRKVEALSGCRQVQAAREGMAYQAQLGNLPQTGCQLGVYSSDLSTQIFRMDGSLSGESIPLGWRMIAQMYDGIVPSRVEEERLRQEIRGMLSVGTQDGVQRIQAAGLDAAFRFLLLLSGAAPGRTGHVCLEKGRCASVFRFLRNPSLCWTTLIEQASGCFPQKVFCQLLILETILSVFGAQEAALCRMCLEDHVYKQEKILIK